MSEKKVVILSKEQGILIRHQEFSPDSYFHPILSKFMEIMISEEEVDAYQGEEFAWIKLLEKVTVDATECQPDCSDSDLVAGEFPVIYKIEDYVAKTVTIAYQCGQNRKEIIEQMAGGATSTGYAINVSDKINQNEQ